MSLGDLRDGGRSHGRDDPQYRSTTTVLVSAGDAQSSVGSACTGSLLSQQQVTSYVDVAKSRLIAQAVIKQLGLTLSPDTVASMMSVDNPLDTVLLNLSVSNPDPVLAQRIASAWVDQLTQEVNRIEQVGTDGKLWVLTSGALPPNPSELLGSQRMRTTLQELKRVTFVIIDAPPLLPSTDAAVLVALTDGAILVTAVGSTRREQVRQAVERLEAVGGRLLGVVANRASTRGVDGYGYAAKGRHRSDETDGAQPVEPFFPTVEGSGPGVSHPNGTATGQGPCERQRRADRITRTATAAPPAAPSPQST